MSRTDAQAAYLNASLLVASPEQFKRLLAAASPPLPPGGLLDICDVLHRRILLHWKRADALH